MTNNDNPLLNRFDTPHGTIPFDEIRFEHYEPAIRHAMAEGKEEIEAICENKARPDFENTIVALEKSGRSLDRVLNVFYPLLSAISDDRMMKLSVDISPELSEYSTSITLNERLWERVKEVYDHRDEYNLDAEDRMLLKTTYESFVNNGALLAGDKREKFRQLRAELSQLTTLFGQNVLKELNTYQVFLTAKDLDGLPQSLIDGASHAAEEAGRAGEYLFTLEQPVYISFMKYSSRRDLRERMYRLYTGRNITGEFSNIGVMKNIADKRRQLAALLGFDNYASYGLQQTMAENPEKVMELLDKLRDAYYPAQKAEFEELEAYACDCGHKGAISPWDYSYYANRLKMAKYTYDEEELRPYFELGNTVNGVFGLANRLYGLSFEEREDIQVYHPDVKAYEVTDADGSYLGVIYTDFFPRESKRPGAWMTDFKGQWRDGDINSRPHVSIVMNFTKPTPSKPSCLTPYEVETLLHEFGHALHGLMADTKYASLSGTNVYRDFVELPSQFNENFMTRSEFLSSFARHYVTGEEIPRDKVRQIVNSSRFGAAYACLRQLSFGYLDMAWHMITAPVEDAESFEREAIASVAMFEPIVNSMVSPQFSHIFSGGYAAGYYSYKWAEVLDADAFSLFEDSGVFNRNCAERFRRNILEKGGTEHPAELYRRFRGRDASIEGLLRRDGIVSHAD